MKDKTWNFTQGAKLFKICFSILFITSFIILRNVNVYGQDLSEASPFMVDGKGEIYTSSVPVKEIQPLFSELAGRYPERKWHVQVKNGYAEHIRITPPLSVGTTKTKDFSIEVIKNFSHLFGITADEAYHLIETEAKDGSGTSLYIQTIDNVPVFNSHITFVFEHNALTRITTRVYPDVKGFVSTAPLISNEVACEIARNDAYGMENSPSSPLECGEGELLIAPKEYAVLVDRVKQKEYYLTWKILLSSTEILFSYTYLVDATTGEIINKWSNVINLSHVDIMKIAD